MSSATAPMPVLTVTLEEQIAALRDGLAAVRAAVDRNTEHVDAARKAVMSGRLDALGLTMLDARLADSQAEFRQGLERISPVAQDVQDSATLRSFREQLRAAVRVPEAAPARARRRRRVTGDRPLMQSVRGFRR